MGLGGHPESAVVTAAGGRRQVGAETTEHGRQVEAGSPAAVFAAVADGYPEVPQAVGASAEIMAASAMDPAASVAATLAASVEALAATMAALAAATAVSAVFTAAGDPVARGTASIAQAPLRKRA